MPDFSKAASYSIGSLLALGVGGQVVLRFLAEATGPESDLGIVPEGEGTFVDYPASGSHVRELTSDELTTLAGQFRQGAREVLLGDDFARNVTAAQGWEDVRAMFDGAAGLMIDGQICRIRSIKPLEYGGSVSAWQLLCDAPLDVS